MDTQKYIPKKIVSPLFFLDKEKFELPSIGGTGFFGYYERLDKIVFITARHCVFTNDGASRGTLHIPYENTPECRETVPFSGYVEVDLPNMPEGPEDVLIHIVDEKRLKYKEKLIDRSIILINGDSIECILNAILSAGENVRACGFPSKSKGICYDKLEAKATVRGVYGRLVERLPDGIHYIVRDLSWSEGTLNGFSGSPVFALPTNLDGEVVPVVIGIVLMDGADVFRFISMSVVCDMIGEHFG